MPLQVYTPRWRDLINKLFVGKRQGIEDLVVLDDIFPMVSLVDETQGEFHRARGETLWGATQTILASAGNNNKWLVENVIPETITIIESAQISGLSGASLVTVYTMQSTPAVAGAPINSRDLRGGRTTGGGGVEVAGIRPTFGYTQDAVAPTFTIVGQHSIPASQGPMELLQDDVILGAGQSLMIYMATANLGGTASFAGYTRTVEPSEY